MSQAQIDQLQRNIQQATSIVDLAGVLTRLQANKDFRKIISEAYLQGEAVRLVHAKANVALQSPADQAAIIKQIDAIGCLEAFFRTIEFNARQAVSAVANDQDTIEELLRGDDE